MTKEEKIRAVLTHDKSSDGKFIFGVKTTKIICRSECPSRAPLEKNIVLFDTMDEANQSGYRPCKRCKPCTERKGE